MSLLTGTGLLLRMYTAEGFSVAHLPTVTTYSPELREPPPTRFAVAHLKVVGNNWIAIM